MTREHMEKGEKKVDKTEDKRVVHSFTFSLSFSYNRFFLSITVYFKTLRLPTILIPEILARGILAQMFHHGNIWTHMLIGAADILADGRFNTGLFWHRNFSAQGIFGTGTFWYEFVLAHGQMKFSGAQIYRAKMSMVLKIPHAKKPPCQKVPILKRSCVETSICQNVRSTEQCLCRNVPVMKHPCRNLRCPNGGKSQ